ncbi:MAG TPA: VCBS repeat-containing protein, partial [Micropepsaceae bacterium]|nr:VCBS repeat-containing protein [Micropepsaceae bacterium]
IYTMRNFTNEAGATFNVSAPGGSGTGYWTGQFAQDFTNAGNYTVNSSGAAYGILSWESAAYYSLVNTSTGLFTVTSSTGAAYGFDLVYGGNLQNDGTINVTGATDVFAIATQGGSVTNTGAITATGNSPGAQTYGIRIDQSYVAITVMNSGTITAKTAITSPIYDPYSEGESLSLTNTGTINGDIDLGVANHDSIVNTGTINGNFFVHGGFVTIDLRAGTFTGSISIAPALDAYARDTIYTGSGNTLIKITGGDTALQATITGGVGGNTTVQYDIASSAALLTHNVDGSWTVSAGSDGVETLTNVQSLIFTDETVMLSAATPSPRADFNGDGKSDFLMQSDYGRAGIWLMNGTTATSSGPINPNPGTTWHAKAGADFNGDGNADVLWQNADGSIAMWFMNGTTIANAALVPINPGPSWQIVGSGDFNGDGKADILFRSTDGTPAIWLMNGNNIVSGALPGPNPGTSWRFVGSGDFNGDGKSDILWQNVTDGTPAIWLMNGTSILAGAALNDPGTTWNLKAAGDFNGDGKSDLLWQNVDGTPAIWLMNGTTVVSGALAGFNPGTTWQAVGTGDFNGDGKADILWQNTDGTPAIWIMNGTSVASGAALANPGSQWHAIAMGG